MNVPCLSENLVIVRAGRNSLHTGWVEGPDRPNFDLLITAYEQGVPRPDSPKVAAFDLPGWKVAGFAQVFARMPEIFTKYKRIALFDDDLQINTASINALFEIGKAYRLDLWQPSLTWDSYFSYACFLQNPAFTLRYVNFVEMMCPFFSTRHLQSVAPLFTIGQETGIDLVWARNFEVPWFRSAVIDRYAIRHTRPVGLLRQKQGFRASERYDDRMAEVLARFGTTFHGPVSYAAIDTSGTRVLGRAGIALRAARILRAFAKTPMRKAEFLILAAAFIRHAATRPLNMTQLNFGPLTDGLQDPQQSASRIRMGGT